MIADNLTNSPSGLFSNTMKNLKEAVITTIYAIIALLPIFMIGFMLGKL
jgi:hypothetical protein